MNIYDKCIRQLDELFCGSHINLNTLDSYAQAWPDAGANQLIFQSDAAYDLGGGKNPALSGIFYTDDAGTVPDDEALLCGPELSEITGSSPYARITLVRLKNEAGKEREALYETLRRIEYTRYHINPEGFMLRISAFDKREEVRIGRSALDKGLSFAGIGRSFINAYHTHPEVEAVKLIFVTDQKFPYEAFKDISEYSENITRSLDHLLKNVKMDCDVCSLRKICAEVENLLLLW